MSTKLCILSYTAIIDFTIFYLILLGSICLVYYKHTEESKGKCVITNSTTLTTTALASSTSTTTSSTTTSSTTTISTVTTVSTSTALQVTVKTLSKVNEPCSVTSDCEGSAIFGINQNATTQYQTTYCDGSVCKCNSLDLYVAEATSPYRWFRSQNDFCNDNVQCFSSCNTSGNKCVGNAING